MPVPPGFADYEALIAAQADESEPEDQVAGGPMFYTSGTTGRPKGVLKNSAAPPPVESLQSMAGNLVSTLQLPSDGTTLLCGPYYHSAQWAWSFPPLLAGLSVVMAQRFDAAQTLQLIDAHQVEQPAPGADAVHPPAAPGCRGQARFQRQIAGSRVAWRRALPAAGQSAT